MTEKHPDNNPFGYTANNPIRFIDPDGRDWYEDESSGKMQWFEGSNKRDGFIHRGTEYQSGKNFYTTSSDGSKPLSFNNALDPVEVKGPRDSYNYPEGFVGSVNKIINNLFNNKPSDEVKLRGPNAFKFALKKTFEINLQLASIATTPTAVGGAAGASVTAFQAGQKGKAIYNGLDALINFSGLVTQSMGIQNKFLNSAQSVFGTKGLLDASRIGKFKLENVGDLNDIYQNPPIQNIRKP